jgi:peptidoglycan L-alanyl-D-glutamate endopeptidase CwlK
MSANADAELGFALAKPTDNLSLLAPRFRAAVEDAIRECNEGGHLDAIVYESYRSNALQVLYFARGRTVRPPNDTVTNAPANVYSWHGYGLAVDVIHRERRWSAGDAWFAQVASVFKRHGCKWGGDWVQRDLPHFQWGLCKPSPSATARELLATSGVRAVWAAVQAAP